MNARTLHDWNAADHAIQILRDTHITPEQMAEVFQVTVKRYLMSKDNLSLLINVEDDPICKRLAGRVDYLLKLGRVKDPELMQSALEALSEIADACKCLLDDMGEPEDGMQANLMDRCRDAIAKATGGQV